jgi:hypothetical protein
VCSFSLTSSSSRAVFHSSGETTGGVFTLLLPPSSLVEDVHEAASEGSLAIHPLCHLVVHAALENVWSRPNLDALVPVEMSVVRFMPTTP